MYVKALNGAQKGSPVRVRAPEILFLTIHLYATFIFRCFIVKGQKAFVRTLFALFEEKWRHNANAILLFRCPARHFIQVLLSAFFLL
ncbi:hypothetical protein B4098_0539 [Heyndrickxia coagulans]|jgi:hypothetical protein|uniref:Uncharacterized protein n=1 Tax=Heyndrickxia coagulans TaxID=1398 RepID=A0A150K5N2_HEYCO|nr:hypothetical protein B4098_0539 [Heyndrickxia coagulans]